MAVNPKDLTVDYRAIQSMPFRDRKALLYSNYADQVNAALTPSQRANLFPNYYARSATAAATSGATPGAGMSKAEYLKRARQGGVSDSDLNRVSGRPEDRGPPKITASEFRAVESNPFLAGYVDKTRRKEQSVDGVTGIKKRDAGARGNLGFTQNTSLSPKKRALLDAIATDSGGGYGTVNYVARGQGVQDVTDLTQGHPFDEGNTTKRGYKLGSTASGRYQMLASNYVPRAKKLGLVDPITGKADFSPEAQDKIAFDMAKDVYAKGTGGRNLEDDLNNPDITPDQLIRPLSIDYGWHILKTEKGMQKAANVFAENEKIYAQDLAEAIANQTTPTAQPDAMAVVQGVAGETPMATELKPQAQTAVAEGGATGFYSELRNTYPDQIDKNSPLWDQVDPELKKSASAIVDMDTGLVGRDALLAADAAAKVLRTNGMIPRVAEGGGGNNHSQNHGSGKSANYSIDLAASVQTESGIKPLRVGSGISPEIKAQMALAARLSSENSSGNFRVGIPLKDSSASMHIQVDPQLSPATWGYSESAKSAGVNSSIRALQRTEEGQSYLKQLENVSAMQPEEKSKLLASMTGIKEKEAPTTVASTAVEVEKKAEDLKTTVESTAAPTPTATTATPAQGVSTSGVTTAAAPPAPKSTNYPIKTMAQGGIIPKSADTQIVQRNRSGDIISATKVGENENEKMKIEPISKMSADALTVASSNPVEEGMIQSKSQAAPEENKVSMKSQNVAQPRLSSEPYSNIHGAIKPMSPTGLAAMNRARDLSSDRRGYAIKNT